MAFVISILVLQKHQKPKNGQFMNNDIIDAANLNNK